MLSLQGRASLGREFAVKDDDDTFVTLVSHVGLRLGLLVLFGVVVIHFV